MSTAIAITMMLRGVDAIPVRVAAEVEVGPTSFDVVGVSDAIARETRVRVRAALQTVGVDFVGRRITVRFIAEAPKIDGGPFDLAVACAVLGALGRYPLHVLDGLVLLGELSLTGAIRPVRGVLPALQAARAEGILRAIVPFDQRHEAGHACVLAQFAASIHEVFAFLSAGAPLGHAPEPLAYEPSFGPVDLADVRGQPAARRALEVAALGGHNIALIGPPGAGKTMLSRRLPGILPPMTREEALEVASVYSVAGLLGSERPFLPPRPFRAPHFTVSAAGLVGGGVPVRPGEVSLAHSGVLFLDELLEFKGGVLEELRRTLSAGRAEVHRLRDVMVEFPARPIVVAGITPCPCGYADAPLGARCTCAGDRIARHRARFTGPFAEQFAIRVEIPHLDMSELCGPLGETSAAVRGRVVAARARGRGVPNDRLVPAALAQDLDDAALHDFERIRGVGHALSTAVLRVARTIADLANTETVTSEHFDEAVALCRPWRAEQK